MIYHELRQARFLKRPNRFIALIEIDGAEEKCHVKNTGRLGELLVFGARILVEPSADPKRKTRFSLICVYKEGQWVNVDSQAPNQLAAEWIKKGGLFTGVTHIKREKTYGNSRFDLYVEASGEKWFVEVKGVTLNVDGMAMFPDAPTQRGLKHVEELMECHRAGYRTAILFVIQMKGVRGFTPFKERQPAFAQALKEAGKAGVKIQAVDCVVNQGEIHIDEFVPVIL